MKIAVVGGTGNVGSHIVAEAQRRGHAVTVVARRVDDSHQRPNITAIRGDLNDPRDLATKLVGFDAVITATKFVGTDATQLIRILKEARAKRWLVVGGAGSLEVAPGVALVDTPQFPAAYRDEAAAGRDFLRTLRAEPELNWVFLSPSALLTDGPRTGKFRVGTDQLLVDSEGNSQISVEDFAIAMVDELEQAKHSRQRFTVGY